MSCSDNNMELLIDLNLDEKEPPEFLYHGTATKFVNQIEKEGIVSRSRQYVHLFKDLDTAVKVGKRHGKPVVLVIDAFAMYCEGKKFYLSDNDVWLTPNVNPKYIKERKWIDK